MKDMPNSNLKNQLPKTPDRASLDRIDSSIGYVKGNIQFISLIAQFAKNDFSDTEVINFCKAVANKSMDPAGVEPASVEIN